MTTDLEQAEFGSIMPEMTTIRVLLLLNAVFGLLMFEWAWYKLRRFRKPIGELNAQFPEIARIDAPHWSKWKHYPGALTLMWPRFFFILIVTGTTGILLNIFLICHDRSKPITGLRRILCKGTAKLGVNIGMIFGWCIWLGHDYMDLEQVNYYEEYLGPREE